MKWKRDWIWLWHSYLWWKKPWQTNIYNEKLKKTHSQNTQVFSLQKTNLLYNAVSKSDTFPYCYCMEVGANISKHRKSVTYFEKSIQWRTFNLLFLRFKGFLSYGLFIYCSTITFGRFLGFSAESRVFYVSWVIF